AVAEQMRAIHQDHGASALARVANTPGGCPRRLALRRRRFRAHEHIFHAEKAAPLGERTNTKLGKVEVHTSTITNASLRRQHDSAYVVGRYNCTTCALR